MDNIIKEQEIYETLITENYRQCYECKQPYASEEDWWCNDCDARRFLDEGIDGKWQFKTFGFFHNCKQLKIDELCKVRNSLEFNRKYLIKKYGQCNECLQLYPPGYKDFKERERWCNNCDTKRFLEKR